MAPLTLTGDYLRSDLGSFLWVYHADVFKVFESMLSVLLFSTHVLLQHVEYVTRLPGRNREKDQFGLEQHMFYFLALEMYPKPKALGQLVPVALF